jgi:hypothetical protein
MKGVSTLVVVILLLLITISLIGFVFIFFQRTASDVAGQTKEQLEQTTGNIGKAVRIDNAVGTSVAVMHVGSVAINLATEVTAYINNVVKTCTWSAGTLNPGGTATCTLNETCAAGADIKLTAPAGPVTEECE